MMSGSTAPRTSKHTITTSLARLRVFKSMIALPFRRQSGMFFHRVTFVREFQGQQVRRGQFQSRGGGRTAMPFGSGFSPGLAPPQSEHNTERASPGGTGNLFVPSIWVTAICHGPLGPGPWQ